MTSKHSASARSAVLLLTLCLVAGAWAEGEVSDSTLPVELARSNFTDYLQQLPETRWVLMEFYAHWW